VLLLTARPAERERPAATPTPTAELLERHFAAFRRAATPADALPDSIARRLRRDLDHLDPRLVLRSGTRVWLVSGTNNGRVVESLRGRTELCTFTVAMGGCDPLADAVRGDRPEGVWEPPRRGRPGTLLLVLGDGARDIRVTLTDGTVISPELHDNAVLLGLPRMATSTSWTTAAGARHVYRYQDPDPNESRDAQGCPALDPLPADADAQARTAALEAVDRLYPGVQEATVTAVEPAGPGLCTRAVTDRSLQVSLHLVPRDPAERGSASLSQGRLLLGVIDGRMAVWSVQH